jgi:hypothetical protein
MYGTEIKETPCIELILRNLSDGETIPMQAYIGPEGSSRLRLSGFLTIGT